METVWKMRVLFIVSKKRVLGRIHAEKMMVRAGQVVSEELIVKIIKAHDHQFKELTYSFPLSRYVHIRMNRKQWREIN